MQTILLYSNSHQPDHTSLFLTIWVLDLSLLQWLLLVLHIIIIIIIIVIIIRHVKWCDQHHEHRTKKYQRPGQDFCTWVGCPSHWAADPNSIQDGMSYMNFVHCPARHESFVAQWLEHPTGVRKVIGSIPVRNFFFVPCSWHVDHIISQ